MDLSGDLAAFYADFGVTALHNGATSAIVILDQPGQDIIGGEVIATDYSIRFPTASFPPVKRLDTFLIDGVTYMAREDAQPLQDGLEMIVPLSR